MCDDMSNEQMKQHVLTNDDVQMLKIALTTKIRERSYLNVHAKKIMIKKIKLIG